MKIHAPALLAAALLLSASASALDLKAEKQKIEESYKVDQSVCMEFDKSERPGCLADAKASRQSAYQSLWDHRDPNAALPGYSGDTAAQKKQIEADYQAMLSICKELNKSTQPACQKEASTRKKAALKSSMTAKPVERCDACGVVERIAEVDKPGEGSWIGKIGGAAAGAALGSQVGKGKGRTVAMVVGALGGAYAGNEVEARMGSQKLWQVTVRMNDGTEQNITFDSPNHGFHIGDKVKLENSQLLKR
ncbi:glycine zipper 2TM domain-containing protein [Chitinilyticum piscinae]|uniref:Glycine zipper 2TM domain-containing protein n=1 Tax=Chitinilyticum piscinae TaxID=2866724 RepID=A0A8J7K1V5_9NEIS|nr:glycine zipper 2TM domain-containing protein [Chitinilyticum piscinae]MBE9609142.1 glycine zipper 2TM domain-containing protein [Chitinilyticum piscinae]